MPEIRVTTYLIISLVETSKDELFKQNDWYEERTKQILKFQAFRITIVKLHSKDWGKNNIASGCELSVNICRALCPGNSKVHAWLHQFLQGSSFHLGFQVCKQFLDCLSLDLEFDQRSSTPGNGNYLPKVSEFGWKSTSFSLEKNRWYDVKV